MPQDARYALPKISDPDSQRVLRFYCHWDPPHDQRRFFALHYYLCDGTTEFAEKHQEKHKLSYAVFVKRQKIEKAFTVASCPGLDKEIKEFYGLKDFQVGRELKIHGRNFVLTDCDDLTRNYYRSHVGYEQPPAIH
eukprot:GHVU01036922.1.p2 GENE.GHVU01036922.1~~GHVU01036922.1.p2  ORF type:complete len:136 (-),score=17.62 GHVU01036922.1:741-1148(-)